MSETRIYDTNRGAVCGNCVVDLSRVGEHLREAVPYPFPEWQGGYCAVCRLSMFADLAPEGRTKPTDPIFWHAESGGTALCSSEADLEPLIDDLHRVTCPKCLELLACESCHPHFNARFRQAEEAIGHGPGPYQKLVPVSALPEVPKTAEEARAAIQRISRLLGPGYHPDTRGENYVFSRPDDPRRLERTFDSEAATRYDLVHEVAFALLGDEIYVIE